MPELHTHHPNSAPTPVHRASVSAHWWAGGGVNADRSRMTARWERSDDGSSWQPWMDMTFTRMP